MYCTRKVADDLIWVGADDRRLAMFEGVYSVPRGVSYNSYLLLDEKTVVFDTVDHAVEKTFLENVEHGLNGRTLDYLVVQHMEPDHSATIRTLLMLYPEAEVVCSKKTEGMLRQFFGDAVKMNIKVVGEGDTLKTGKHEFTFLAAPMVHWPEVIVTYDLTTKTLFSADAFGTFGALNGALFADEVDFFRDYLDEARRYYTNIVGKYGVQVQALLKKAATVEIQTICPLHGFVWRENIGAYLEKYQKWSLYEPEVSGVMIAYASVYGNTENAANILACKLRDKGIKTTMFDVSVAETSEVVAASFQYSHLVFAAPTYNGGIFIKMDEVLRDIEAHSLKNRTVAFMENGTWAVTCGKQMKEIFAGLKGMNLIEDTVTIKSALADGQEAQVEKLAEAIAETM
ncbi:FprA family A-type flavoprotein [Blautia stercoris]